ncbi:MAG: hypothetical protein A2612_00655 [Candidatus Moranbacteria bacterium RIFOXYD1_FULL_44_12]|nr:MAG: hypothetical protein A2612_00655 [Candidatus Moranbacteria bacterium RIFOXYD1_FULL_44_12]
MAVAFVIFSGKAAIAGVFGNDLLELTADQELIVRAALGEQVVVRVKVAENIPLPQAQIPTAASAPVVAPVAQAPVNHQPPPIVAPYPVQTVASPVMPSAQVARPPANPPAVQPRQPETKVASVPPAKPVAPVAPTTPAKPVNPVKQEQRAKIEPAPNSGKEARKVYAMRVPVENIPAEKRIINGKHFKDGETVWAVVEEINGVADQKKIRIMNAPPEGAEIVPFRG